MTLLFVDECIFCGHGTQFLCQTTEKKNNLQCYCYKSVSTIVFKLQYQNVFESTVSGENNIIEFLTECLGEDLSNSLFARCTVLSRNPSEIACYCSDLRQRIKTKSFSTSVAMKMKYENNKKLIEKSNDKQSYQCGELTTTEDTVTSTLPSEMTKTESLYLTESIASIKNEVSPNNLFEATVDYSVAENEKNSTSLLEIVQTESPYVKNITSIKNELSSNTISKAKSDYSTTGNRLISSISSRNRITESPYFSISSSSESLKEYLEQSTTSYVNEQTPTNKNVSSLTSPYTINKSQIENNTTEKRIVTSFPGLDRNNRVKIKNMIHSTTSNFIFSSERLYFKFLIMLPGFIFISIFLICYLLRKFYIKRKRQKHFYL